MPIHFSHIIQGTISACAIGVGLYAAATISGGSLASYDISYAIAPVQRQSVYIPEPVFDGTLLMQADKEHSIGTYTPSDLLPISGTPSMELRQEAATAFELMREAALAEDVRLNVISAYRSYSTQQTLFAQYSRVYGEEEANTFSARPGYSEHQLGTTVDFGNNSASDLTKEFEDTLQGLWLVEHAHSFGFVMSYPEGKEAETGYIYEPWHYRYIGTKYSHDFINSELTLNQYLTKLAE